MIAGHLLLIRILATVVMLAGVGVAVAADPSMQRVSVVFVDPERFTDVKDAAQGSQKGVAAILDELARFVRVTGDREHEGSDRGHHG